jgi:serpin B
VLDELPARTVAVLVNAISFEGQWATPYEDYQVNEFDFRSASGDSIPMDMLCETSYSYYETDLATGFMKSYEGGRYAFLVMLPTDESINANEFLSGFTADDYNDFINSCSYDYDVYTRLPEFEYDYDMSLVPVLESMGMTDAFDENLADFTGIGIADSGNNIYISQVLHKTHIELDREGTRAAASTVVIMEDAACAPLDEDMIRYVYCDRPFAYAIVDTSTMNPIFLGTYNG